MPFLRMLLGNWQYVVIGLLVLAVGIQSKRVDWAKDETLKVEAAYATFRAEVKVLGEKAKAETAKREADDRERKVRADAEHAKTKSDLAGVYDAYRKLRDSRSGSSVLPQASATSRSPNVLTFDRSALDRGMGEADGVLQSGAEKILRRGDEAITDLNVARKWAK